MKLNRNQLRKMILKEMLTIEPKEISIPIDLSKAVKSLKDIDSNYSIKTFHSHDNILIRFYDGEKQITNSSTVANMSKILDKAVQKMSGARVLHLSYSDKVHPDYVGDDEANFIE